MARVNSGISALGDSDVLRSHLGVNHPRSVGHLSDGTLPARNQSEGRLARWTRHGSALAFSLLCGLGMMQFSIVPGLIGLAVVLGCVLFLGLTACSLSTNRENLLLRQRWFIRELSDTLSGTRGAGRGKPARNRNLWLFNGIFLSSSVAFSIWFLILSADQGDPLSLVAPPWSVGASFVALLLAVEWYMNSDEVLRRYRFARDLGSLERARKVLDVELVRSTRSVRGPAGAAREIMRQLPQLSIGQVFELLQSV